MTTVNLVMVSLGEYSDRTEMPLFVTTDRAKAEDAVNRIVTLRREFEQEMSTFNRWERDAEGKYVNWSRYSKMCEDIKKRLLDLNPGLELAYHSVDESLDAYVAEVPVE